MEVEAVRRRSGFRPYSSASWPIRGNPIILKMAPTCTLAKDMINKHGLSFEGLFLLKENETLTNILKYIFIPIFWMLDQEPWHAQFTQMWKEAGTQGCSGGLAQPTSAPKRLQVPKQWVSLKEMPGPITYPHFSTHLCTDRIYFVEPKRNNLSFVGAKNVCPQLPKAEECSAEQGNLKAQRRTRQTE